MERKKSYRKITGRWRRILSSMLVLAMILSSVPTTGAVYAAELPSEKVEESAGEVASSEATMESTMSADEESSSDDVTDEQESESSSEIVLTDESADQIEASSVENSEEAETETAVTPVTQEEEVGSDAPADNTASGTNVIFQYIDSAATTVNLMGINDDWATGIALEECDNVFTGRVNLANGTYSYKYKTNIDWAWSGGKTVQ